MVNLNNSNDLLIPQTQETIAYDPLTEPKKEETAGTTSVFAAKLALLDSGVGIDYETAYKNRFNQMATLSIGEQEMFADQESLKVAQIRTIKDIQEFSFDIPESIPGTTIADFEAAKERKASEFDARVVNAAIELRGINFSAMPLEKQLAKENIDKNPNYTIQDRIDYVNQLQGEAGNFIMGQVGAKINPETGEWDTISTWQAAYELGKSFILPFRQNMGGWDINKELENYNRASPEEKIRMIPIIKANIIKYADGDKDIAEMAVTKWLGGDTIKSELTTELVFSPLYFMGWGIGRKLKSGASAVSALAYRGARKQAGVVNASAVTSPAAAAAAGTTPITARVAADPLLGGLTKETVEAIELNRLKITSKIDEATGDVVNRSPLTVDEQEAFIRSRMANVPNSVSVVSRDAGGFKLELTDGTVTQRITFTKDGIGQLDGVNELSAVGKYTLSPSAIFRGTARKNVQTASEVELQQAALGTSFGNILDEVMGGKITQRLFSGISSSEWKVLDDVLIQGDRQSVTFSARELLAGVNVEGRGVVQLSEKQIAKYYEVRHVYDELYRVRDSVYRADLEFRGFRGIYTRIEGKPMAVAGKQAFATTDNLGRTSINVPKDVKRVAYNGRTGLTGKDVDPRWAGSSTGSYVKFDKPVKIGNEIFEYGFISNSMLKDIKPGMLGFRDGYVPLHYNRVNYVVRQVATRTVNGVKTDGTEVRRFFNTREEADAFANSANASITDKKFHYKVATDREIRAAGDTLADDYVKQIEEASFNGRYFQARNEEPIRYGIADIETPRMTALDSLNRYTRSMSWAYPQTAFRQRMIEQFKKTYATHLVDPSDWRSGFKANSGMTTAQQNAVEKYRDTLKDWLSVRTEGETFFNNIARHTAEKLEQGLGVGGVTLVSGKSLIGTREKLMRAGDTDVISSIKGATHHAMLGFYNLSQFFVQGLGLTVAASVNPKNFAKALPRYTFLRASAYMHPSDPKYFKMLDGLAGSMGIGSAEAREMAEMFRKTGLARSLRNTSADYNAAENGLLVNNGMIDRVMNSGLVFYREGELLNRIISWSIGYLRAKELKAAGKGTADFFDDTMKEYYKASFNLQRANAAGFQKGWMSIPTQYYQITAKYMEHMVPALLGREGAQWTRTEALRSLAVSSVLFGTAGIPFGKYLTSNIRNYVMGKTEDGGLGVTDEKAAVAIQGGMIDLWLGNLLGLGDVNVSLSSRTGIAAGVVETIDRWKENPTVLEAISGATGSLASRSWQTAHTVMRIVTTKATPDENFTMDKMALASAELGRVISSWRNIHTAHLWYNNQAVLNSKDKKVYDLEIDPDAYWALSNGEIFAKAIGFDSTRRGWERELANEAYASKEDMTNATDSMRQLFTRLAANGKLTEKNLAIYEAAHMAIRNSFSTEEDKASFDKQVVNIFKEDTKLMKTLEQITESEDEIPTEVETNPLITNNMTGQ